MTQINCPTPIRVALPTLSPFIVCVSSSAPNGGIRAIYERKDCASGWHLFGVAGLVFGISTLSGGCSAYWRLLRGILVLLDTSSLVTPMAPTTRAIYIDAVHGLQRRLLALRGLWGCRAAAHKCQTVMPGGMSKNRLRAGLGRGCGSPMLNSNDFRIKFFRAYAGAILG